MSSSFIVFFLCAFIINASGLFPYTIEEDAGGIVDGIVENRVHLIALRDESVALVEELDASDDDAYKQGKLEHSYQAAEEAVDPSEADGFEQL